MSEFVEDVAKIEGDDPIKEDEELVGIDDDEEEEAGLDAGEDAKKKKKKKKPKKKKKATVTSEDGTVTLSSLKISNPAGNLNLLFLCIDLLLFISSRQYPHLSLIILLGKVVKQM